MRFSNRITDAGAERLLAPGSAVRPGSGSGDPGDEALRSFVATLRAELPAQPSADREAILITRLADSARRASLAAEAQATAPIEPVLRPSRGWRPRLVLFGRVALAAALAPALLAALAFAGVELPEPAQDAFERVGIELPNQAGGDEATPQRGKAGDDEDEDAGQQEDGAGEPDQPVGAGVAPGEANGPQGKHKGKHKKGGPQGPSGGVPPGHGGTPSGQGGVPPGNGSGGTTVPPPEADPPSTPPGQGGVPPGQAKPK
jgi:hypothetical protein